MPSRELLMAFGGWLPVPEWLLTLYYLNITSVFIPSVVNPVCERSDYLLQIAKHAMICMLGDILKW